MQHPEVTEMLDLWVSKAMADGILLTGTVLHQKWRKFADLVCVPEDKQLNLSEGWLTRYKTRNGLKEMRRHGEAASVASETVHREQHCMQELIKSTNISCMTFSTQMKPHYSMRKFSPPSNGNKLESLINMASMPPDCGLSDKQQSGMKGNKV